MPRRTGYVFHELYMWHDAGTIAWHENVQPGETWENPDTKKRLHSLLAVSGILDKLTPIAARPVLQEELEWFHTKKYVEHIRYLSETTGLATSNEHVHFAKGGYKIAALSCGGVLAAVKAVVKDNIVDNAYCLVRPPGHHACRDHGMGFCIFNNIVIAAHYARKLEVGVQRIAIVDYDVHHGNGTEEAFWDDPETLFISLHQDNNYPANCGRIVDLGGPAALKSTINIPLPPGSGDGAYAYAFEKVVLPALRRFKPDLILVSSGFDGSYMDPLGRMMISSEGFGKLAQSLLDVADECCGGRIVFAHEGGYSKDYVPFCGLAVVEALVGEKSSINDPYLEEAKGWAYQDCQPHQAAVVDALAALLESEVTSSATTPVTTSPSALSGSAAVQNAVALLLKQLSSEERARVLEELQK